MRYRGFRSTGLTPILAIIIANVLFFMATMINPQFIFFLGLQPALVLERPWTIISYMFLHAGWWHLFGNMLALFFMGGYLLRMVGEVKFLIVYFVGGIIGGLLFVLLSPITSLAIGASGAVFAVGGALAVMAPRLKVVIFPIFIPIDLWIATIIFMAISFTPSIAWQAHLGGLVVGLIAGYIFRRMGYRSYF